MSNETVSQAKLFATAMYKKIKKDPVLDVKAHSVEIIRIFAAGGTLSDFLVYAGISRQRFVSWKNTSKTFRDASLIAKEVGRAAWLQIGLDNVTDKEFNTKVWDTFGRQNFGGTDKITLSLDSEATPYEHYQQVVDQAACGDFSSSEIKQLMESVSIGIKAHETCMLQAEIDGLKDGLAKMEEREAEYQSADNGIEEEDKAALEGETG